MTRIETLIANSQSGDQNAKELLVKENTGLIWSVARRFIGRGVEVDDLFQLGCVGFLKAVDGFDLAYGTQFSTYAVPKITGEIRRYLRDDGAIKVPRSIKEQAALINNTRMKLTHLLGREPTIQEVSEQSGIQIEEIAVADCAMSSIESIQQQNGDDCFSLENIISDGQTEELMIERLSLRHAISQLAEREAKVINLRYFHGLTQEQIARILSVSQVQVSRIEKKAISRLRELIC